METASYIGLSLQSALKRQMNVVSNNLANMNTPAYKGQHMLFQEYLNGPGRTPTGSASDLSMVMDQAVVRDSRPGPIEQTGNPLDVAIEGDGFLVVDTVGGPRYTRSGHLALNSERTLVDSNGLPVLDDGDQPIRIPANATGITIDGDGNISASTGPIGRIRMVTFADEFGLTPLGGGLYVTNEVPADAEEANLVQGAIEGSNVQPIAEMTQMIEIARAYQKTQGFIQSEHERLRTAIRQLGKIA